MNSLKGLAIVNVIVVTADVASYVLFGGTAFLGWALYSAFVALMCWKGSKKNGSPS